MNFFKKINQMKNGISKKRVTVVSSTRISNNFQRVILTGEDLKLLPDNCAGQYIKLMFSSDDKPVMRTYTIRDYDAAKQLLSIDFVIHDAEHGGFASHWAVNAKEGDVLTFGGPGPIKSAPQTNGDYLFVADMTALPAAAIAIERLANDAHGKAFIQVGHESDIQHIEAPQGLEIKWLVGHYDQALLADDVAQMPSLTENTAIWCACEFNQMRAVRRTLSDDENFNRKLAYFSSYWKPGITEDGHKKLKREDARAVG
jgi:NADPH-dependent ferric siderophore reductase